MPTDPATDATSRRVSGVVVFVSDTERSLRMYRDVLGLRVGRLRDERESARLLADRLGLDGFDGRITPLAGDAPVGRITLVESRTPRLSPRRGVRTDVAQVGQSALVMSSPRLEEMARGLSDLGLARITDPSYLDFPAYGRFVEFVSFDPDHVALSLLSFRPVDESRQTDLSAPWRHADDRRVSPLLRVALRVRDLDASLALYRDLLGLEVMESRVIRDTLGPTMGLPACTVRLSFLGPGGDDGLGILALAQISDPTPPVLPRPRTDRLHRGQVAVVLGIEGASEAVRAVRGRGYRSRGSSAFYDGDGFLVALEEPGAQCDSLFSTSEVAGAAEADVA